MQSGSSHNINNNNNNGNDDNEKKTLTSFTLFPELVSSIKIETLLFCSPRMLAKLCIADKFLKSQIVTQEFMWRYLNEHITPKVIGYYSIFEIGEAIAKHDIVTFLKLADEITTIHQLSLNDQNSEANMLELREFLGDYVEKSWAEKFENEYK